VSVAVAQHIPRELVVARELIEETLGIIDRSLNHGPVIQEITRDLAHLVHRLRHLQNTWLP